ncbi:hypothetical protein OSTOST_12107 [Ostertagia ostertagi]
MLARRAGATIGQVRRQRETPELRPVRRELADEDARQVIGQFIALVIAQERLPRPELLDLFSTPERQPGGNRQMAQAGMREFMGDDGLDGVQVCTHRDEMPAAMVDVHAAAGGELAGGRVVVRHVAVVGVFVVEHEEDVAPIGRHAGHTVQRGHDALHRLVDEAQRHVGHMARQRRQQQRAALATHVMVAAQRGAQMRQPGQLAGAPGLGLIGRAMPVNAVKASGSISSLKAAISPGLRVCVGSVNGPPNNAGAWASPGGGAEKPGVASHSLLPSAHQNSCTSGVAGK